jgi:hypothetical protein
MGLSLGIDWDGNRMGQKIVASNKLLREGSRALGVGGSARTESRFWYFPPMRAQWKPQHSIKRTDNAVVTVSVPESVETDQIARVDEDEIRKSLLIQAALADIGSQMGFKIWLPKADRTSVLKKWNPAPGDLLEDLPLSFDKTLLKTIEQIDVIWLNRRSIVRAFEVEHTTSIYSGLLRMADLLAMHPNLDIKLHIVAPSARRDKVLSEINRPVFSLLEGKPLAALCSYLPYEAIEDLHEQKHLEHLKDDVLKDYEEHVEQEED